MQATIVLTADQVAQRFKAADPTQVRVSALGQWCLLHSHNAAMIIKTWRTVLSEQATSHSCRVGLLYVIHEILYSTQAKATSKSAGLYIEGLTIELPLALDAMFSTVKNKTELRELKERVGQLLECWTEMRSFPTAVLSSISRTLNAVITTGGGTAADGATSVLTVSSDVAGLARVHAKYTAALDRHRRIPHVSLIKLEDKYAETYQAQRDAAQNELSAIVDAMRHAHELLLYTNSIYVDSVRRSLVELQKRQTELCKVTGSEVIDVAADSGAQTWISSSITSGGGPFTKKREREEDPPSSGGAMAPPAPQPPQPSSAGGGHKAVGILDDLFED